MSLSKSFFPMFIMGLLFFIFGFVTWLNGSLIPFLKVLCELSDTQALLVTFAFYISYTVMALPMAYLLEKVGYRDGMAIGLGVMAVGSLLFIPAAQNTSYMLFLVALFMLGSGLTILQNASNPYIVFLGDVKSAAMRISVMGIINKSAGVMVPFLFSSLVLSGMPSLDKPLSPEEIEQLSNALVTPYMLMAGVLVGLVFLIKLSHIPEIAFEKTEEVKGSIFAYPKVVLGSVALFFYVGIEVIAGDTIGLYAQSLGVQNATTLTSFTMAFMVMAYVVGVVAIPRFLSQQKALTLSAFLGIFFTLGIVFSSTTSQTLSAVLWGWSGLPLVVDSVVFVALLGLSNALVWPTIWPLALDGLGAMSAKGSALLIMAISGGALLPLAFGGLSTLFGEMQFAYSIALVCYGFILLFALKWHKMESWR